MTSFFDAIKPGLEREIGSHTFGRDEIIAFAKKFDPQPFHLNDEAAKDSLFGALCASGWHVTAIWMRLNIQQGRGAFSGLLDYDKEPVFGPSPGIRNLRWLHPVFPGDTITYRSTTANKRLSPNRPGWGMLMSSEAATNQNGRLVCRFDGAVTLKVG
jgi:acyl dehydratase